RTSAESVPAFRGEPAAAPHSGSQPGLLRNLAERFAPEIDQLKGLAIGVALGLVRDMVKDSVPPGLAPQLENIIDSVTQKLGGQTVSGPVLDSSSRSRM